MATKTLGTTTQTALAALQFGIGSPQADIAVIAEKIKSQPSSVNDAIRGTFQRVLNEAWSNSGLLYLPGDRGVIKLLPQDWIGVDVNGWPVVVSGWSISQSGWTHT